MGMSPAHFQRTFSQWVGVSPKRYQQYLTHDHARRMLAGIVAFELRVTDLQCALKLNQHRKEAHAAMHAAYSEGDAQAQALAGWMRKLGLVPDTTAQED